MDLAATQLGLDPVIGWVLRLFLAAIFARALIAKLRAPADFALAVAGYQLLPAALVVPAAGALLLLEVGLVGGLLVPAFAGFAAGAACLLLLLYAAAIAVNLARGRRDIDCGCSGPLRPQLLHESLIARNLVYGGLAWLAAMPLIARPLHWLDAITLALAVIALVTLAIAVDTMASLAPSLRLLRRGAHAHD